ncbi:hypothetical protein BH09DEP1_BH09DEP1_3700 [soil metagenome]
MVGYRILRDQSIILPGSYCPHCKQCLCWYDNIPLLSYFLLGGKCRYCKKPISYLYPLIELITAVSLYALVLLVDSHYWLAYGFFFSALIVNIRTDLEQMLLSRYTTLLLIPFGWILSAIDWLPISLYESVLGSILGYFILFIVAKSFWWATKKDGMGQGDLELLAFIGAFIGPAGCCMTLFIASTVGAFFGLIYIAIFKQNRTTMIPFGPFLALGAFIYALFENSLNLLILGQ